MVNVLSVFKIGVCILEGIVWVVWRFDEGFIVYLVLVYILIV